MTALLDVNVLVALMWEAHEQHELVQRWFTRHARNGWATCPFTQAGFVRILSSAAFSRDAVAPLHALAVLTATLENRFHRFWPDDIGFAEAVGPFRGKLHGHRQVTDAYLLGLAIRKRGRIATLDQGLAALLPDGAERGRIELIAA